MTGIPISSIIFLKEGNTLNLYLEGVKVIVINNFYYNNQYQVEEFIFQDGSIYSQQAYDLGIANIEP